MGKNIIICSDGTGNTAIKGRGTNVFKLFEAVDLDLGQNQKVFYDDGVGTESFKLLKLLGGAFGYGLSRNVRQLYANLARVYQPGDNIYLFGFSRGAFTVRTLGGFIHHCGILDPDKAKCKNDAELMNKVRGAYKAYRHRYNTLFTKVWRFLFKWYTRSKYGFTEVAEFKQNFAYEHKDDDGMTPIHFIGVWDTVSAVGFPVIWIKNIMNWFYRVSFPDHKLTKNVRHAYQALSIDDKRKTFHPEMWDEESDDDKKRIYQVWFAGVHSNVGGGYPKQGMSLVALDWMMEYAGKQGLKFIQSAREQIHAHANVNDKLYDSRSGLAVYYRYEPRNIDKLSTGFHIKTPFIHESVLRRSLDVTDGYAPGNLPKNCQFVATGKPGAVYQQEQKLFHEAMESNKTLLERITNVIKLRMWLHYLFVILSLVVVGMMIKLYSIAGLAKMFSDKAYLKLAKSVFTLLLDNPYWLLIPVIIVVVLSIAAKHRIQNNFSSFWYALKRKIHDAGLSFP